MLYGIVISLIVIICFLLIVVVLLQPGQREGLSGGLAAGMAGGGAMGARRTADLLSKTTTVLAILFLSLSVLANFTIDRSAQNGSTIQEQAQQSFSAPGTEEITFPAAEPAGDADAAGDAGSASDEPVPAQD